jgi:pimeloyl-CoA synthetase
MAVITLEVPSRAQMGYGLGKAMQYGVEYEVLSHNQIELSSGDEMKLARMMVAFQGKLISSTKTKNVRVEHPRHEA